MQETRVEYQAPQAHSRIDVRGGRTSLASDTPTLKVGDQAPDFVLPSHLGTKVQLSALRGHHNVLLAFFPLDWHPRSRIQFLDYEVREAHLERFRAEAFGITTETLYTLEAWSTYVGGLTIPLLSDHWPYGAVARQYGVLREDVGMPQRAMFIVDKRGEIAYIDVHKLDEKPDAAMVFDVLQGLD